MLARPSQRQRCLDTQRLGLGDLADPLVAGAHATSENDDRYFRPGGAHLVHDYGDRPSDKLLLKITREISCPGIEDLHRIDPGIDLTNEIRRRRLDHAVDQLAEPF